VYSSSLDGLSADSLRLQANAIASGANVTFVLKRDQVHDWEFVGGPDSDWRRPSIANSAWKGLLIATTPDARAPTSAIAV
jgi:hypothetical protein